MLSTTNFFISVIFIQHAFLFSRRCVVIYYAVYDLCLSQRRLRNRWYSPDPKKLLIASNSGMAPPKIRKKQRNYKHSRNGACEVIDISVIDRCVGFSSRYSQYVKFPFLKLWNRKYKNGATYMEYWWTMSSEYTIWVCN